MLLVFRFMTKKFQSFNSDLAEYESLTKKTTSNLDANDGTKSDTPLEPKTLKAVGLWYKLQMYLGYFSPLKKMWFCFRRGGTHMKKKVQKIKQIQEVLKDKYDIRKMIVEIASLIYNQRNILKALKMTPPEVNFMKDWLNKAH